MRIVTLEEHAFRPDMIPLAARTPGDPAARLLELLERSIPRLSDIGPGRLAAMDAAGVTVQVLSVGGPAAHFAEPEEGVALARRYNDWMAEAVRAHPDRYAAFAHLPTTAPAAAADELERCVVELGFKGALIHGMTRGLFLDDPSFEPLLARAEKLDAPIYIHPGVPPEDVRRAYFDNLPGQSGYMLATAGWGWHSEVALHVLRLVLSGALDRHPRLQLIIGHMGEGLPAMLGRIEEMFTRLTSSYLERKPVEYLHQQLWITTAGFFRLAPFMATLMTFGADRILFSIDYPFASEIKGRAFLEQLPISPADRLKIAHQNADTLLRLREPMR
jgi:predicted TIM-barrel fold metal-dependent hydrolase